MIIFFIVMDFDAIIESRTLNTENKQLAIDVCAHSDGLAIFLKIRPCASGATCLKNYVGSYPESR